MTTISHTDLTRALKLCAMVTERRIIPVIAMIRLQANGETATISATDIDNDLSVTIPCESAQKLDVLLRPEPLAHIAKHAGKPLTITADAESVTVQGGGLSMRVVNLIPPTDRPSIAAPTGETAIVQAKALGEALANVRHCISTEETRYYLNGVYLHAPGGNLVAVATDGHRLAEYTTDEAWQLPARIFPTKAAKITAELMKRSAGQITVTDGGEHRCVMRLAGDGWTLTAKTIDGKFPDYPKAFPKFETPTITATISRGGAAALPKAPGAFRSTIARIDPAKGEMSVKDDDFTATAPCGGAGEAFGVNLRYLREFLRLSDVVKLEGDGPLNPFWVRSDNPRLRAALMPARV